MRTHLTPTEYPYTQADDGFTVTCSKCGQPFHMSDSEWDAVAVDVIVDGAPLHCPNCYELPTPPTPQEWAVILATESGQGLVEFAGAVLIAMFVCCAIYLLVDLLFRIDLIQVSVNLAQYLADHL